MEETNQFIVDLPIVIDPKDGFPGIHALFYDFF